MTTMSFNKTTTKSRASGVNLRLHACPRCGGSAYLENLDEAEWRCLQCGRLVPVPVDASITVDKKAPVSRAA